MGNLLIPCVIFGQSICSNLNHKDLFTSYINKMADSTLQLYLGKGYQKDSEELSVFPIVRILMKNESLSYTYKISTNAIFLNKTNHTIYDCNLKEPYLFLAQSNALFLQEKLINKKNQTSCIVYFLESERNFYDLVLYCNNDGDKVISKSNYDSLFTVEGIIKYRYGTVEKYQELCRKEEYIYKYKKELIPSTLQDAYDLIKKDWNIRSKYVPIDTVGNINLLVQQINRAVKLSPEQSALLNFNILQFLRNFAVFKNKNILNFYSNHYLLYGMDVYEKIKEILTNEQFLQSEEFFTAWYLAIVKAKDMIYLKTTSQIISFEEKKIVYESEIARLFK